MLATETAQLPTERWPQVSLTVGLAVCEALEELLARGVPTTSLDSLPAVQLKWPNDGYIEGRKICGVLFEVPRQQSGRLLLGIGINVNNSIVTAPNELRFGCGEANRGVGERSCSPAVRFLRLRVWFDYG